MALDTTPAICCVLFAGRLPVQQHCFCSYDARFGFSKMGWLGRHCAGPKHQNHQRLCGQRWHLRKSL